MLVIILMVKGIMKSKAESPKSKEKIESGEKETGKKKTGDWRLETGMRKMETDAVKI